LGQLALRGGRVFLFLFSAFQISALAFVFCFGFQQQVKQYQTELVLSPALVQIYRLGAAGVLRSR